jgi:ABC-2 type transport system permease protein
VAALAQAVMELRLTARRGENVLAMVGIPVAALLFVTVSRPSGGEIGRVLPSTMALAIVASGLVNLGIATAYERGYGVLKRLGGSPLGRSGSVAAKIAVVLAIAVLQVVALGGIAAFLGWQPPAGLSVAGVLLATLVGAATFAGIGLAIAGLLRAEAALVGANVIFLLAMVFGGPLGRLVELPAAAARISSLAPTGALADALTAALGAPGVDLWRPLAVLTGWAAVATLLAVRTFRWE